MARKPRVEFPGACYQVISRGNQRQRPQRVPSWSTILPSVKETKLDDAQPFIGAVRDRECLMRSDAFPAVLLIRSLQRLQKGAILSI